MQQQNLSQSYNMAGLFSLALRLVVGWTYFSAFWRRVALENKLDPEVSGYIGEKFNHFLPNALGIKPIIEYLVTNPDALWWAMVIFTIVEGIVGLLLIFGLFTRLMSIGVFGLAMGILLGSGWIGTTCLDEWQIGVLGIAAGFTLFLSGSDKYSLDYFLLQRNHKITQKSWFSWIGSGILPLKTKVIPKVVLTGALLILFMTLFTNQVFHGGVWGNLHNKSVKPKIEIADSNIVQNQLSFQVYRVEGADVYGSFLIGIELTTEEGKKIMELNGKDLSAFPKENIANNYVAMVKPGAHSMIIPLGAKATLTIEDEKFRNLASGSYELKLIDISGATWKANIEKQ
ncbi:thiosulfate dehydrogenase [quinone] large subunit [Arenibacter nanhaiticus]|uniref:Thiosulfate dehydrogenase [quinone] large subunit n=1 Tax=Arenibacter nanhaiticus TaxID=558155 RepID=A0A1M6E896_9FLAO|nr:TQO small subunit DoxD [Arenibacter nanhaiticus]SHI81682.1 thiosulfate dehydrogenase [quinone] large subunit [Arenibacter nanhaiticus]